MQGDEESIAERIARVQSEIAEAARASGRAAHEILLLAVSKKQPAERVQAAYDAGLRDFGENYVQGLEEHASALPADIRWHFIGHLQSNKAKRLGTIHLIHSVDSAKLARLLGEAALAEARTMGCLLNVNISSESSKSGLPANAVARVVDECAGLPGIRIEGLMCIPSPNEEPRRAFARLRELREACAQSSGLPLAELSMGMSDSYREAIAEGSTIVRVGTAIFGERA